MPEPDQREQRTSLLPIPLSEMRSRQPSESRSRSDEPETLSTGETNTVRRKRQTRWQQQDLLLPHPGHPSNRSRRKPRIRNTRRFLPKPSRPKPQPTAVETFGLEADHPLAQRTTSEPTWAKRVTPGRRWLQGVSRRESTGATIRVRLFRRCG